MCVYMCTVNLCVHTFIKLQHEARVYIHSSCYGVKHDFLVVALYNIYVCMYIHIFLYMCSHSILTFMCVCMYVCVLCVCTYIYSNFECIYIHQVTAWNTIFCSKVYAYTYICDWIHACRHTMCAHIHIHTYIHTYICIYIEKAHLCIYIHLWLNTCMQTHNVRTYTHTYIHTYICIYIFTHLMEYIHTNK